MEGQFYLSDTRTANEFFYYNIDRRPVQNMSLQEMCEAIRDQSFDSAWLQDMWQYVSKFTDIQISVLVGYTYHGDRLINAWLRDSGQDTKSLTAVQLARQYDTFPFRALAMRMISKMAFPESVLTPEGQAKVQPVHVFALWNQYKQFLKDSFLMDVIARAASMLLAMMQNAPTLTKDVLLFRGVTKNIFPDSHTTLVARGFMSTSTSGGIAAGFATGEAEEGAERTKGGYLLRMHVPRGTHCLPVFSHTEFDNELEVLLAPGTRLALLKHCESVEYIGICDVGVGIQHARPAQMVGVKR